jgi:phospholipid-transporting ATPase
LLLALLTFKRETNLKLRKSPKITSSLQDVESLAALEGSIICQVPNEKLYQFYGRMDITGQGTEQGAYSLDINNLLHRGAQLRNTQWIYGIAVYLFDIS